MNLNETAQALILLNRAHSAAQTAAVQAHLPPPQFNLTEVSDTIARAHQFRELVIREGPAHLPNFRARRWVFHIRGRKMRLSLHNYDPPAQRIMVMNEIEFLLRCAFQKCLSDGAVHTDIVHFYLECGGLDFSFCFNPSMNAFVKHVFVPGFWMRTMLLLRLYKSSFIAANMGVNVPPLGGVNVYTFRIVCSLINTSLPDRNIAANRSRTSRNPSGRRMLPMVTPKVHWG